MQGLYIALLLILLTASGNFVVVFLNMNEEDQISNVCTRVLTKLTHYKYMYMGIFRDAQTGNFM